MTYGYSSLCTDPAVAPALVVLAVDLVELALVLSHFLWRTACRAG